MNFIFSNYFLTDMDEKWELETRNKKSAPKKGRRAGLGFNFSLSPRDDEDDISDEIGSPTNRAAPSAPPRSRKSGGWAGESLKSGKSRMSSILDQEFLENTNKDSDDDIPEIPNLDDYGEDELAGQIAKAPLVGVNRVVSYKELETDLLKHAAFASLEEVNLSVLTKCIQPEIAVQDPDIPWTRESLFAEMVGCFNEEKQKQTEDPKSPKQNI